MLLMPILLKITNMSIGLIHKRLVTVKGPIHPAPFFFSSSSK